MAMKQIKLAEATELQLDWLVARIEGDELPKSGGKGLDYSSDWAAGGPIIEREGISVIFHEQGHWTASNLHGTVCAEGPTPLSAAMRCYAASKLGDTAEVPRGVDVTTTIYIHPAYTDQAGQCRIYATKGLGDLCAAIDYQVRPNLWREVGIMNSRGELVCFDGPREWRQTLVDSQPLMAGTTFTFGELT